LFVVIQINGGGWGGGGEFVEVGVVRRGGGGWSLYDKTMY